MDKKFWHNKWQTGEIGFHQNRPHPVLAEFDRLDLAKNAQVFVPLCGKSLDIIALADMGYKIIGVELSEIAVCDFFTENKLNHQKQKYCGLEIYKNNDFQIFCGDFFELSAKDLQNVKAVYDRASLIALPYEMQLKYARHLQKILPENTKILLVSLEYDQSKISGPPFSTPQERIEDLFANYCKIEKIMQMPEEDFRGIKAVESIYILEKL